MIPYVPQPVWHFGPVSIHAFGVLVALALLTAYGLVLKRASGYGIDRASAATGFAFIVVMGLTAGWLWAHTSGHTGIAGSGLAAGAGIALVLTAARRKSHFWRVLDLFMYAFPFAVTIARIGCFLAHDHVGLPTNSWIGVRFPGGTRFDLGLLYAIATGVATGVMLWLDTRALPEGVLFGATLAMVAASRLIVLQVAEGPVFGDHIVAAAAAMIGTFVFAIRSRNRAAREGAGPEAIQTSGG